MLVVVVFNGLKFNQIYDFYQMSCFFLKKIEFKIQNYKK